VSGNGPGINGQEKPRIACWVLGYDPGPGGLLVGANYQPAIDQVATASQRSTWSRSQHLRKLVASPFPPCGRLMLLVPIFGVGLPYGWASWPTWPRIDVRGRLFGGLRPLPILGYRSAVRPPMCVLVVGTVCNLSPACPGFFFISATREIEPPQRPRLSQRGGT